MQLQICCQEIPKMYLTRMTPMEATSHKSCWSLDLFRLFPIHVGEIVLETSTLLYIFDTKNRSDHNICFFFTC